MPSGDAKSCGRRPTCTPRFPENGFPVVSLANKRDFSAVRSVCRASGVVVPRSLFVNVVCLTTSSGQYLDISVYFRRFDLTISWEKETKCPELLAFEKKGNFD